MHRHRLRERELSEAESALLRDQANFERGEAQRVEAVRQAMIDDSYRELDAFNVAKKAQLHASILSEKSADAVRLSAQLAHEAEMEGREAHAKHQMQVSRAIQLNYTILYFNIL